MKHPKFNRSFEVVSELPKALERLKTLAYNYRWTWDHEAYDLLRSIDKELWTKSEHNPAKMIASLSKERLAKLSEEPGFLARLDQSYNQLQDYLKAETWFDKTYPGRRKDVTIAYFCAEFGISEGLPIYSGGLGVLAGDHLKAASDLGIPLVGVGLLYSRGYFKQRLNSDGWQQEVYPVYDFYQMPLELLRGENDQPIRVEVEFPDRTVSCQIWRALVGRISLYLLDSNVLENSPSDQGITDTLYGGNEEIRIQQEMILGIGGLKALRAVGIKPTVCHMNEGHAAFLSIERIRQFMHEHGCDFRTARQVIVNGNVFTTHTPVPAGFDLFTPELLERYMGKKIQEVNLGFSDFLRLGRIDPDNQGESFNMAVLAMENANHVNGVAKLHAAVTREMFQARWPDYPEDEVPVEPITNGIHTTTWISRGMAQLFDEYLDPRWRRNGGDPEIWSGVDAIPDEELWSVRETLRADLVRFARKRLQRDLERRTMGRTDFSVLGSILDPRVLTIGFARRFATYKRASLMLTDRERLLKILFHAERPVQILLAGKSHPRDDGGKRIIQDLFHFSNFGGARNRLVMLEDYDMQVARHLVLGVDVWLNNPRRPMEASGTSGMKVVPNGGLNCSILDGWWDEAYSPQVGWAIGDRSQANDEGHQDWLDSSALYGLLENEIAPKFYHRNAQGVPKEWVAMIKASIKQLTPQFSTARMVGDYAKKFYMPASEAYEGLSSGDLSSAKEALDWRTKVQKAWRSVRFVSSEDDVKTKVPVGQQIHVKAQVALGDLSEEDVQVEVLVGRIGPNRDLLDLRPTVMKVAGKAKDGVATFEAKVACDLAGHQGYALRVRPHHPTVAIPSELNLVTWQ